MSLVHELEVHDIQSVPGSEKGRPLGRQQVVRVLTYPCRETKTPNYNLSNKRGTLFFVRGHSRYRQISTIKPNQISC